MMILMISMITFLMVMIWSMKDANDDVDSDDDGADDDDADNKDEDDNVGDDDDDERRHR